MAEQSAVIPSQETAARAGAHARRNNALAMLNGVLGQMGMDFIHAELILAGMIYALTRSALMVALVTLISKAGVLAPQLFVSSWAEHLPRKRPFYFLLIVLRGASSVLLIGSMWMLLGGVTGARIALFFGAFLVLCAAMGASGIVASEMMGRMIPIGRIGSFYGTRSFLGGLMATIAGTVVIQPILERVDVPLSYVILAVIGCMMMIAAMAVFAMTREEEGPRARERTTLGESWRRGRAWLRADHNYRAYITLRASFRVNYLSLAFFIPYGAERLTTAGSATNVAALGGIMVAVMKLSRLMTGVAWGTVSDRRGFRACFLWAGALFLAAPVLALAAPELPEVFHARIPFTDVPLNLPLAVYLLGLAAVSAAFQADTIAGQRFLIGSAPPARRISYQGFCNTVTSPLTLLPLAGAWLAATFGIAAVFYLTALGGIAYLAGAWRIIPESEAMARRDGAVADDVVTGGA